MAKWIDFHLYEDTGKTKKYDILTKDETFKLGEIKWFSRWRKYAFFPQSNTVFEKDCMLDIIEFIDLLMFERKKK
jgi:hypothetical protein